MSVHFDEDPEHRGDGEDSDTIYLPSKEEEEELEDAYWANKDNDIKDIRNPGSNEKGEQKWQ